MIIITRRRGGVAFAGDLGEGARGSSNFNFVHNDFAAVLHSSLAPRHCLLSLWEVFMEFDVIELIHFSPFCIVASSELMWMYLTHMCH